MEKTKQSVPPGRIAKVPMVMQLDALECGAACLDMILGYYGRFVSLSRLREECGVSRDGSSMKSMQKAAESYGLEAKAFRYRVDTLKAEVRCPCVLYWQNRHFVVLAGCRRGRFVLNDPARGTVVLTEEQFRKGYSGICMTFEPGEGFVPGGKHETPYRYTLYRLRAAGGMIALVLMTELCLSLLGIIEPVFSRLFVDYLLTGRGTRELTRVFFIGFGIFAAARVLTLWIRRSHLIRAEGKIAVTSGSSFIWHLLCLPMDFFNQRMPGDIMMRHSSNEKITSTLITEFTPLVLDLCAMVFYLIIMLRYSWPLALIGAASVVLDLAVSAFTARKRLNLTRVQKKNAALLYNTAMSGLGMLENIKAGGNEEGFFNNWAGVYAACSNDRTRVQRLDVWLMRLPSLLSELAGDLVLCAGVLFIIRGRWTIGLLSAFTGYLAAFSRPAGKLVQLFRNTQEMYISMERIKDVMEYPADLKDRPADDPAQTYSLLHGDIEMDGVTFGYNRQQPPLIRDFSMKVSAGQSVAFVGASGSGKSTLASLLTGICRPWSGEVRFDGKPLAEIPRCVFTASVSSVDQQISMFGDTIRDNITLWDTTEDEDDVVRAARDADIYDSIIVRQNGFATRMTENGRNFSGGESQRVEIARALASDPSVLVMDEATSALDAETEHRVVNAIRARGITTVMISHRLCTVRDCDQIIVLRDGEAIDRGTHDELMARCEYYAGMITNE